MVHNQLLHSCSWPSNHKFFCTFMITTNNIKHKHRNYNNNWKTSNTWLWMRTGWLLSKSLMSAGWRTEGMYRMTWTITSEDNGLPLVWTHDADSRLMNGQCVGCRWQDAAKQVLMQTHGVRHGCICSNWQPLRTANCWTVDNSQTNCRHVVDIQMTDNRQPRRLTKDRCQTGVRSHTWWCTKLLPQKTES
jgi:hypothetical protein